MRLLHTKETRSGGFLIEEFQNEDALEYAILSHTWNEEEVTFQEILTGRPVNKKGFQKIKDCCARARQDGIEYAWIDTCCIDKTSSAELSEAINSMYRWYENALVCYTYLVDVEDESGLAASRWFTRGWTLQELIAPLNMLFFNKSWMLLGTKDGLQDTLALLTGIPPGVLSGQDDLDSISVAQRLSWAATRVATRPEDRAYSLLGIFGINMPLIYGEGGRAFIRLQEEILKVFDDQTIFAWRSNEESSGLLASSPDAFRDSGDIISHDRALTLNRPLTQSNKGIHLELEMTAQGEGLGLAMLNCVERGHPNRRIGIYLRDLHMTLEIFERVNCAQFGMMDPTKYRRSDHPIRKICVQQKRPASSRKRRALKPLEDLVAERPLACDIWNEDRTDVRPVMALRAPEHGDLETLWMHLTRVDANPNLEDDNGRAPLSHAAEQGNASIVELLLAQDEIDCDQKDKRNRSPLSYAASAGHELIIDMLIETRKLTVDSKDADGLTPLAWAARNGHSAIVLLLLIEGADIESRDHANGWTPLLHAVVNGHDGVVQQLLSKNAQVEARDGYGWPPLLCAARAGHLALVQQLLERGVDMEAKDEEGWTALISAAENGHNAVVKLLLSRGANPESKDYHYGWTPVGWAAVNGHDRVLQQLLSKDVDIESRDNHQQRTPLSWAAGNGHEAVVQQLLEKHADQEAEDNLEGRTPLSYAAANGHVAVVIQLLEKGVNLEAKDREHGWTPLTYAARNGHKEVVELLQDALTARIPA